MRFKKKIRKLLLNATTPFLMFLARRFSSLPLQTQIKVGSATGGFFYFLSKRRKKICMCNLKKCFPELSTENLEKLSKESFKDLGMGAAEAIAALHLNDLHFKKIKFHTYGMNELKELSRKNISFIIFSAHFSSIELMLRAINAGGAIVSYKKYSNKTFNSYVLGRREKYYPCIEVHKLRKILTMLKSGKSLFYFADQDSKKNPCFSNFFNTPCSMSSVIERMPEMAGSQSFFCHYYRDKKTFSYHIYFQRVSGPVTPDSYNQWLEAVVRQHPEQYFWVHRRFKTRPHAESENFYNKAV